MEQRSESKRLQAPHSKAGQAQQLLAQRSGNQHGLAGVAKHYQALRSQPQLYQAEHRKTKSIGLWLTAPGRFEVALKCYSHLLRFRTRDFLHMKFFGDGDLLFAEILHPAVAH